MTCKDAIARGVYKVREPHWNPFAWLELPQNNEPWARLYDPVSSAVLRSHGDRDNWGKPVLVVQWPALIEPFEGKCWSPEDILAGRHHAT